MSAFVEANGLGKRYGRKWALSECALAIPAGKAVGLVGSNGAGKTTLLHLSVGLLHPTAGAISVLCGRPGTTPEQLAQVGFVAQDAPIYAGLSVRDHLRFGAWMNPGWDAGLAADRIARLGLDPHHPATVRRSWRFARERLTMRQFRTEAVVGFALLAVLAIVLAVTGPHLAQVNDAFSQFVSGDLLQLQNNSMDLLQPAGHGKCEVPGRTHLAGAGPPLLHRDRAGHQGQPHRPRGHRLQDRHRGARTVLSSQS